ncbi:MAG: hypothetical protein VYA53_02340 [Acidobacteriota bacterium]|nr:hypothetical protein [Acidobacteriota bacterium]
MKCEEIRERMIDVLYGEEMSPRKGFEFFKHLGVCSDCDTEYLELLDTREKLGDWNIEPPREENFKVVDVSNKFLKSIPWWTVLQRVAAGVLIMVGAVSIVQHMGYWGGQRLVVSQQQLTQTVQDMMVAHQDAERQLMLGALLQVKEDIDLRERDNLNQIQRYLVTLEQRYIAGIEENNHYMRNFLSR